MAFNGMSADMYEKQEILKLTRALVKKSEEEFKFTTTVVESDVDWKLTTYFYKKHTGMTDTKGSVTSSTWSQSAEPNKKLLKDMAAESTGKVKLENPEYVVLRSKLKVLVTGKQTLEKKLSSVRTLLGEMEQHGQDTSHEGTYDNLTSAKRRLDDQLSSISKMIAECNTYKVSSSKEEIEKAYEALTTVITEADNHNDAVKALLSESRKQLAA